MEGKRSNGREKEANVPLPLIRVTDTIEGSQDGIMMI
jgi:hypothetical protein